MKRIFLVGLMGSGKSYWGKKVAQVLHWQFIDLDGFIEEKEKLTVAEIFSSHGEAYFRESEKKCLLAIATRDEVVVATGGGAPCFHDNMRLMNGLGETYYLKAKIATIVERVQGKMENRPLLKGKISEELPAFFEEQLKERERFYLQAKHVIEVEKLNEEKLGELFKGS